MDIAEFKKLKTEDMPLKIRQMTSNVSVAKNMPLYALYLKIYLTQSFSFLNTFAGIDGSVVPKYVEKLTAFRDLCVFLEQKNLYVNLIEKDNSSNSYYYSRSAGKTSFSSLILNIYQHYLEPHKAKNSHFIIETLTALKNMGDEVKAKELSFDIRILMRQDKVSNREIDPVFLHFLELYGFDIFNSKEIVYTMWQKEKNSILNQILSIPAPSYFEALENAAQKQNKVGALETLIKKELTALPEVKNILIDKLVEKLEISKEKKHFDSTLKNYNKKAIKKRAKEKKAQEILLSSTQMAEPTLKSKTSKFKL